MTKRPPVRTYTEIMILNIVHDENVARAAQRYGDAGLKLDTALSPRPHIEQFVTIRICTEKCGFTDVQKRSMSG